MRTQSADTSPEAERVEVALLRSAPIWRKIALLDDLNRGLYLLAKGGLQRRHPRASPAELRRRLAEIQLGPGLAAQVYPDNFRGQADGGDLAVTPSAISVTLLVIEQFEALSVPYVLGGSMASSAHGVFRATKDADILADISEAHADILARALDGRFYVDAESIRDAVQRRASFNVIHLDTMFKVDVFIPKGRAYDRSQLARGVSQIVAVDPERRAVLASPEDTVLAKLEWYRAGGEISDRQWNDILSVLKVQTETIDREYLRQWAGTLEVRDLLDRALDDAGLI